MNMEFANLSLSKPLIMGIVNVTPDSFFDGGRTFDKDIAIRQGLRMYKEGASLIDVGGESTQPGSSGVDIKEELRRTIPVIEGLVKHGVKVSIDTSHPEVMEAAFEVGAEIVNDVTALTGDSLSLGTVIEHGLSVILMHMRGTPKTMQENPSYKDAPTEIRNYLLEQAKKCENAGVKRSRIAIDPGIGFGKSTSDNLKILNNLDLFIELDYPVVLGTSRKRFIGEISGLESPEDRLSGSIATCSLARQKGVHIFRVHDVLETSQALGVVDAISHAKN